MSTITDRLAAIAATIDRDLEDERISRQQVAEDAARRVRDLVRSLSRAKDPQPATPATPAAPVAYGPFDDDRAASAASSWAREGRPPQMMQPLGERDLLTACGTAGVHLGEYDRRILRWLAGFEPASTAVVAGIIVRASAAACVDSATVRRALADAVAHHTRQLAECAWCADEPELPKCQDCAESLTWKAEFEALLARGGAL